MSGHYEHGCRTYWGHCGCDLPRGHDGPHIGLHLSEDETTVETAHVMGPGVAGFEHVFGEDSGNED